MDYDEVFGNAAAAIRPRGGATLRNKAGRKAGNLIPTPTASDADADSMLDEFCYSDTPTPPPPQQQQPAPRKNQNQVMPHQHHHQHHHHQRQQPNRRAREDESDDTRFSGSSDNDEFDQHNNISDREKCHQRRGMEHEKQQLTRNNNKGNKSNSRRQNDDVPPLHSSDIINVDDDDDDDDDNDAAANGCKMFDGIRVDTFVNANGKAYIDEVKQKLGNTGGSSSRDDDEYDANNNAVSRKGAAAANATNTSAGAGGKKHFRGHHHKPSVMAQSLSPHRKNGYRIPKKSLGPDTLASRTHPLFKDPLEEAQYRQEYNRSSTSSAFSNSNHHHHHQQQHYRAENVNHATGAAATLENRHNRARAGKSYSSQVRGNATTATVPSAAATTTTTTTRNGFQFIGGSMATKRAAEAALQQRVEASRRSEKQQQHHRHHHEQQQQQHHHLHHHHHQQQQQQQQQHRQQHQQQQATEKIKCGVKRMIDAAVDLVSTPLKKLRNSSTPEEEEEDGSDYNSTFAVDSVDSHPKSRFADTNSLEEDHSYDGDGDDDDEVVNFINACGHQPLSSEEIQGITPKYTTPPDREVVEDLENSQPSSTSSSNLWGIDVKSFGVQRAPKESAPATKKQGLISEIVRRSARKIVDTLDPSPNHNSRNNRENNSASSQQQKRQRSQSSNTATTSSKRTSGRQKKDMKEKDRNQTTCDTWLTKSTKQGAVFDFDNNDEEYEVDGSYENSSRKRNTRLRRSSSSGTRSSLRLKGSKGKEADQVITIDSSDEGDDTSITTSPDGPKHIIDQVLTRSKRAAGDVASIDAVRIAIGLKVFKTKCTLSFQFGTRTPYIQFSYQVDDQMKDHTVYLRHDDELKEVKYHIAPEDDTGVEVGDTVTVISFRITPSHTNNLTMYSKSYNQVEGGKDIAKNYISVEPRNTEDFQAMLEQMRQHDMLGIWCTAESEFQYNDLEKYANALLEDSKKEEEERLQFVRVTRSSGRETKAKSAENNLLLVYPFDVDEAVLSGSAADFTELGGKLFGLEAGPPAQADNVGDNKKRPPRTHYITICEEDKDRLRPGQFLNDSLVDFWMRWISRGEVQYPNSIVHFFTSHFMSTLKSEGVQAVASWTSNKNINVFAKKLIFIPINATLHWSLCVVVNPGLIANSFKGEESPRQKRSCILFFDSLRMHQKQTYAKLIRQWLNCEWKRLGKGKVGNSTVPFDNRNMPLLTPKIPYQDNGCDCGVFVCRYAYNLYIMRNMDFTLKDISDSFNSSITRGVAFQFDQSDIPRIRKEFASLIDNLSEIYLPIRKEQDEAEKRTKDAEKRAKRIAKRKESAVVDDQNRNVPETTVSAPSRMDGRDVEGEDVAVDESATVEKENGDGSNEIATLTDSLSELDFLVSKEKENVQIDEQHSAKQHVSTDVDEAKKEGDGKEESVAVDASAAVDQSDSDGDTTVLCSSDSEELDGATPSENFSYDEEVAENRTTSKAL